MSAAARRLRPRLAGRARCGAAEIEQLVGKAPAAGIGHWLHIVRAPPSGTWERRRADLYALAEDWLGPAEIDRRRRDRPRRAPLPRRLRPGHARRDRQLGGRLRRATVAPALERLRLRRFASEDGDELVDLPRAPLPDPRDAGARPPARDLGRDPARPRPPRGRSCPSATATRVFHVRMPQSVPTFLVDGAVAGTWRHEDGRVDLRPVRAPRPRDAARPARGGRADGGAARLSGRSVARRACGARGAYSRIEGGQGGGGGRSRSLALRRATRMSRARLALALGVSELRRSRTSVLRTKPRSTAVKPRVAPRAHDRGRRRAPRTASLSSPSVMLLRRRAAPQPTRTTYPAPACTASTASSVSASAADLSGRWRSTRAKRSATPPG